MVLIEFVDIGQEEYKGGQVLKRRVRRGGCGLYGRGIRKLSPGPGPITSHRAQRHPFLPLASSTRTASAAPVGYYYLVAYQSLLISQFDILVPSLPELRQKPRPFERCRAAPFFEPLPTTLLYVCIPCLPAAEETPRVISWPHSLN